MIKKIEASGAVSVVRLISAPVAHDVGKHSKGHELREKNATVLIEGYARQVETQGKKKSNSAHVTVGSLHHKGVLVYD